MTNVNSSWAFSFTYNYNQQNVGGYQQPFAGNQQFGQNPMANMMQGMGLMFAGMDMIDNGAVDGSIFQMLMGGPQQAQQPYGQQQPVPYGQQPVPFGQQQPAQFGQQPFQNPMAQNPMNAMMPQDPMMAMLMQMMAMFFTMFDKMDDGQVNGSVFRNMMGQNGQQAQFPGMNFPQQGNNGAYATAQAGPNGAQAAAGTNGASNQYQGQPVNGINNAPAGRYGGTNLSQEQVHNAKIIAEVGKRKGASKRDIQIAIATAMQESGLKNINYGDRDSVGLFQQRPSCGWGSVAQCTNPEYAAGKFYDSLLKNGNRNNMSLTAAAQQVQRSGFPNAYAKWESMAVALSNQIVS